MNDSASSCSSDSSVPHLIVFHVAIKRTGSDKNCLNRWITLFFLAGVLFLSATAFGQSSPFDPGYSALVEKVRKNEAAEAEAKKREAAKPKPMEIRIVEGKAYNINASTNWESIRCTYQKQFAGFSVCRKVERVKTGEYQGAQKTYTDGTREAHLTPVTRGIWEDQQGAYILLKHLPNANLVTGQELAPRLMRAGRTNYQGSVVAVYDCGTLPTAPSKNVTEKVAIPGINTRK